MNKISETLAGLDSKKRALLAALLKEGGVEASRAVILPAARDTDSFLLSFAQERLWFFDRLWPGDTAYSLPTALRLSGPLDIAALRQVFVEIVRRHETLRTLFVEREGRPFQVLAPPEQAEETALPVADLAALPGPAREAEALILAQEHEGRPLDLGRGPLLSLMLLRLGSGDHILLFNMHHIVSDGWSMGLLTGEVGVLYDSALRGLPLAGALPALTLQYVDYAVWQRAWLQGEELERQLGYWRSQLTGAPPTLDLPVDRPRPATPSFRGGQLAFPIAPEVQSALAELSRRSGVTLFMTLLASFFALLQRLTGQDDLVVGTPIAGRQHAALEKLIGFFVNNLALRCDLSGDPAFEELIRRVQRIAIGAFEHQDLPFEKLVEALQPERSLAHQPVFQVLFAFQNAPKGDARASGTLEIEPVLFEGASAKLDLSLSINEIDGGLMGLFDYSSDLFDKPTIEAFRERFGTLLAGVVEDPSRRLSELPLLTTAERHQLLHEWNDTAAPAAGPYRLLTDPLEEHAARRPEAPAASDGSLAVTYAELNARANRLARHLAAHGIVPGERVGLSMERSVDAVVGILGTLKAGAAWVPLDPSYPADRLAFMAEDAGISLLMTHGPTSEILAGSGVPRLDFGGGRQEIERRDAGNLRLRLPGDSLAYVVYTSGSTGRPKGVACHHCAVLNLLEETVRRQPLGPGARHTLWGNLSFDVSIYELFLTLREGGRLEIVPQSVRLDGRAYAAWLAEHRIEGAFVPPFLLADLDDRAGGTGTAGEGGGGLELRRVLTGVEPIREPMLATLCRRLPGLRFQDGYGPTETTIAVTVYEMGGETDPEDAPERDTPIGRPIQNVRVHLLDRAGHLVPRGVAGEVCIAGVSLARCYLGRPDLTAARYGPDPFGAPGGRLYRTGDLARRLPDGNLEFLGRIDHQIKVRGFRIELGEIEAALGSHPDVRECAVLARPSERGDLYLAAYAVPAGESLSPAALLDHLRARLPEPMLPAAVVPLPALPLTANGKVDREALARIDPLDRRGVGPGGGTFVPPRTPVEEVLAAIWAEILGFGERAPRIGSNDNFFELSGHSLLAAQVAFRVRQTFGVELPLRRLFERATLADLALEIEAAGGGGRGRSAGLPVRSAPEGEPRTVPSTLVQQWMWNLQGGAVSPFYNMPSAMRLRGRLDVPALRRSLAELARRHEPLRTRFHMPDAILLQEVDRPAPVPLPAVDLSGLPAGEEGPAGSELHRLAVEDAALPFDLSRSHPFRMTLIRLADGDHAALFNMHHIISDGWSMEVLRRELRALYLSFARGAASPLPELPIQFGDFAAWQRHNLDGGGLAAQLAYWQEQLSDLPPVATVPGDRPLPEQLGPGLVSSGALFQGEAAHGLRALAREASSTLPMVLAAGIDALIHRYTGAQDIILGTVFSGRDRPELLGMIGAFLNLLPMRADLSGNPGFRELLERVRNSVLAGYGHQDLPLPFLLEKLFPNRVVSRTLLFRVLFNVLSFPLEPGQPETGVPADLAFEAFSVAEEDARYDLVVEVQEGADFVHCSLRGAADLFDPASLENIAKDYESLLAQAVAAPDTRLDRLLPVVRHQPSASGQGPQA